MLKETETGGKLLTFGSRLGNEHDFFLRWPPHLIVRRARNECAGRFFHPVRAFVHSDVFLPPELALDEHGLAVIRGALLDDEYSTIPSILGRKIKHKKNKPTTYRYGAGKSRG